MMMLVRVAAGSVMGVQLHAGENVLDCQIHKGVRDLYILCAL